MESNYGDGLVDLFHHFFSYTLQKLNLYRYSEWSLGKCISFQIRYHLSGESSLQISRGGIALMKNQCLIESPLKDHKFWDFSPWHPLLSAVAIKTHGDG